MDSPRATPVSTNMTRATCRARPTWVVRAAAAPTPRRAPTWAVSAAIAHNGMATSPTCGPTTTATRTRTAPPAPAAARPSRFSRDTGRWREPCLRSLVALSAGPSRAPCTSALEPLPSRARWTTPPAAPSASARFSCEPSNAEAVLLRLDEEPHRGDAQAGRRASWFLARGASPRHDACRLPRCFSHGARLPISRGRGSPEGSFASARKGCVLLGSLISPPRRPLRELTRGRPREVRSAHTSATLCGVPAFVRSSDLAATGGPRALPHSKALDGGFEWGRTPGQACGGLRRPSYRTLQGE